MARAGSGVQIRSFSWPDEVKGDRTRISVQSLSMFTVRSFALSLAAQCIVIGPVCVFATGGRCVFVGLLPRSLEIACIDLHQVGFVGESSNPLQLIKFWPSCAPGKEVCGGAKFFVSKLLRPTCNVCVSPERCFHYRQVAMATCRYATCRY